ncbi:MAG: fatty acyl-AMP ligase [Gammaproteobacteria bacterium]|nr:fatty acyl-AMP ligase [Gammaproteobacteria bacterium]
MTHPNKRENVFHEMDFVRLTVWRAAITPHRVAFGFQNDQGNGETVVSYGELDRRARAIAAVLQQRGFGGQRAVLLFQPGIDYVLSILGCWYAGITAVPVYAPRLNTSYERVRIIVNDARAAVMLSTSSVLATLAGDEWQVLRHRGLQALATDDLPVGIEADWKMPAVDGDTLAVLQYTSGSTGTPKGVRVLQRHLMANSRMISRAMHSDEESVGVVWLPPYHDMGLVGGILQPFYAGFPVHLMAPATFLQRPMRWLEAISRYRGTISAAPNFAYDLCVRRARPEQIEQLDLSSWRVAVNGAEPIRAETLKRFSETFAPAGFDRRAFFPSYGMAETTLMVTAPQVLSGAVMLQARRDALALGSLKTTGEGGVMLVSSGQADPETEVAIVDPDSWKRCGKGVIGEIWVSGPAVTDGYWARPDATKETFHAKLPGDDTSWLRTGDLGVLQDNELYVTGRIKDLIVIRGHNYYPHDIEATALSAHPALRPQGAAAFAIDTPDGEGLGLVVEMDRGWHSEDLDDAAIALRNAISREHQLQINELVFVRANTIPKTSSGKVQRLLVRNRWLAAELEICVREATA